MCVPLINHCLVKRCLSRCRALAISRRYTSKSKTEPPCYPPPDCCPPGCVPPPPPGMFAGCCPDPCKPETPPQCPNHDCAGRKTMCPPPCCYPGPIPPNPCCPRFHKTNYKRYKSLFFFFLLPLIILQTLNALGHEPCPKGPCREYEYMRRRSKRFPWGDGDKTFFHNDHYNNLPDECEPPPLVCYPQPQPCD